MANSMAFGTQTFNVGDTLRVFLQVKEEGDKVRLQVFEGILIGVSGREENKMFTVRKIGADSIGVERIFPVHAPVIAKIELKRAGQARRAKLNYLRDRVGKQATKVDERKTVAPVAAK